jgi:sodium-coupled neutral amino acid transporter 11
MVGLVAYVAPISETLAAHGGIHTILRTSTLRLETVFVGLGVLSFAFVCQHSAFIIAGSLERPTKVKMVNGYHEITLAMRILSPIYAASGGYLGYMESQKETF